MSNAEVDPEETVCRFLMQKSWFNHDTGHISPQAFKPRTPTPPSTAFKTSVYRIDGCTEEEIFSISEEQVNKKRTDGRKVLARAEILAKVVLAEKLIIDPAPNPHPRHADIIGWPDEPDKRLDKANQLAIQASLKKH